MSEKKIALLCQHFYPEMISTGMHMTELSAGLVRNNRTIRVYCAYPAYKDVSQKEEIPAQMSYEGIEIIRKATWGNPRGGLLSRGLFSFSFLFVTLFAVLRDRSHLSGLIVTTNPPFIGLVASLLKRFAGLPYITIVYDIYPDIAVKLDAFKERSLVVKLWEKITRHIFANADALVVIGRDMDKIVRSKLKNPDKHRIELIPNWSDERHVKPIARTENPFATKHYHDGHFVIQYSGRMGRTHNLEPLIEAAELLGDEPVLFQLIGDGAKQQKLVEMVHKKKLLNVQFLPYQPIEELHYVLSAPDIAVVCLGKQFTGMSVPSKSYGIMASGRPMIGFLDSQSEIAMTIKETDCGIVLEEPTGTQVAQLVRELMANQERVEAMGANGYRAFLDTYTLSHAVQRYDALIESVLSK